ncbi:MAG: polysaccharide deacetylase family protein, partial [Moorellaceae bacterium]
MKRIILIVLSILAGLSVYMVSIAQEAPLMELEGGAALEQDPGLFTINGSGENPKGEQPQLDTDSMDKLPRVKEETVSSQLPVQKDEPSLKSINFWYKIENGRAHTDARIEQLLAEYNGIFVGPPGKTVYLTFDLGYEAGFTPQILATLKKEKVKGAFFVTGDYVKRQAELVKRISSEGHLIGNHTANHPDLSNLSREEIAKELKSVDGQLESLGLTRTTFFRPPGGVFNEMVLETA